MNKLLLLLAFSAGTSTLLAQDCSNLGTLLGDGDETVFPIQSIGFAFPLGGATYTDVHVSTNGFAYLSNAGVPAPGAADYTATQADFMSGSPRVAPLWTDLHIIAANSGEVYIENTSGVTCTITWKNAQNYNGGASGGALFNLQARLSINGDVEFFYSANATNNSSIVAGQPGIVGVTPGQGAILPLPSDLSLGGVTGDVTLFEEWIAPQTFDLNNDSLQLIATNPGYAFAANGPNSNCAGVLTYGTGCVSLPSDVAHELFPLGPWDITAPAITLLRGSDNYLMLDQVGGTFVTPTAGAAVIATGDDVFETVTLSGPMPTVGGTTMELTVCSNGYIALSANQPSPTADYSPSVAELEAFTEPTIGAPWYDYSPNAGGQILFEEISGIAYVTWNNVVPYQQTVGDTFQYQFNVGTGDITIVYQSMSLAGVAAWHTPLLGYTPGDPSNFVSTAYDMSTALASTITVNDGGIVPLALDATIPLLGSNWDLTTTNIDPISPVAITFFGDGQSPFPIPLTTIGLDAPGCFVHINTILGDLTGLNAGGTTTVSFMIPNMAAFAGAVLTAQSLCLTLVNNANVLTSNGVEGRLGY